MARPKKPTQELFFDQFADFELADQEIALRFLAEIHRQAKRQATKKWFGLTEKEFDAEGKAAAEASAGGAGSSLRPMAAEVGK